ncbi:MAG: PadR family transcriptional regulator [Chryseotalea sp. WA131a]|nr:MAG: PadR family transcriptional regulator [Chryseotalea sp. WA131a]
MKGTNLGEFEELVLLTVGILNEEAYSIAISNEISKITRRNASFAVVHSALNRLEEKGYVDSKLGGATKERGGRSKRLFTISSAGKKALLRTKEQRDELWSMIPKLIFKNI